MQKRVGIAWKMGDNRQKAKDHSNVHDCARFFGKCGIARCNLALIAARRGAFVPGGGALEKSSIVLIDLR